MKTCVYINSVMIFLLFMNSAALKAQNIAENQSPVTDKLTTDQLQNVFNNRHSTIPDIAVNWYNSDYGYYGTYTINDQTFMTMYDKHMSYDETLVKMKFENAPSSIRNSFASSEYKNQKIVGYWEVLDGNRSGFYFELNDEQGTLSRVWADNRGHFSRVPGQ